MDMDDFMSHFIPVTLLKGTAIYDRVSEKIYVKLLVPASHYQMPGIAENQNFVFIKGNSSIVVKVEALEQNDNSYTLRLNWANWASNYNEMPAWINSEEEVLLKGLSNSKELEKPSATIDVTSVLTPAVLLELKEQIASTNGVTFDEAVQMAGLNSSSKVTVKNNQGNPKRMFETFVADKVKATLSKKGLEFVSERKKGQVIISGQPATEVPLFHYLQDMRQLHEQQDVIIYTVTVIDKDLNVIMYNKPIKEVLKFKKDGKIGYRIKFKGELIVQFSRTCTVIIEKLTVTNTDHFMWSGSSGILGEDALWNQEGPFEVNYFKKNNDGNNAHLELASIASRIIFDLNLLVRELVLFTVANKIIYGTLKLTEENKVILTKPEEMGQVAWAKGMAAFKPSGKGYIFPLKVGSPAKDYTLQLKVELGNVEYAWDFVMQLQATPSPTALTVGQLLAQLGPLKVLNAEISPEKVGVNTLNAVANLDKGTVKWFNDAAYIEILVKNNSRETFNVVNSNGTVEGFQEVNADAFLGAAVADVKKNYENNLKNIINPTSASDNVVWSAKFQKMGERIEIAIWNAEVKQTTIGRRYRFYHQRILEQFFGVANRDDVMVIFTRPEFLLEAL